MNDTFHQPPLWKIWANPIFKRYMRSRLRFGPMITWIIVVLIASSFAFFLVYLYDLSHGYGRHRAANDAFLPNLIIQMVILLLMGTGSVATGVGREGDDGMTPYLRLTPMTPLAKIVGYLFGLPIREYVLFACTLPFTIYAISFGTLGFDRAFEIYAILFLSAILYHLTGCVAGTVVSNQRFAGRLAQILVVMLYFALPKLALVGFVFFEYLTLRPVMFEMLGEIRRDMPMFGNLFDGSSEIPAVRFFNFDEIAKIEFTLLIQASLVFTFIVILYRKWRQETHHILGKNYCIALNAWILLLLVGNALPLMAESREFFPRFWPFVEDDLVDARSAYLVAAFFGLGVLLLAFALISIMTPSTDEYTRGLRRARKLGLARLPRRSDGATATRYVLLMAAIGAAFWSYFLQQSVTSRWVEEIDHRERLLSLVPVALLLYIFCYHGVLERFGRRALLLFVLFVWIVPLLGGVILKAAQVEGMPILLGAISGFSSPFYLITLPLEEGKLLGTNAKLMRIGCLFSVFAHSLFAIFLTWSLSRHKRRIRRQVGAS